MATSVTSQLRLSEQARGSLISTRLSSPQSSRLQLTKLNKPSARKFIAPRASEDRNPQDEWRPPSDWDKAWKTYKKVGSSSGLPGGLSKANIGPASSTSAPSKSSTARSRPSPLKHMEQYVTRNPTFSDYPLSEETDAVRRTEREALGAWTDTRFTYAGFGAVALMFVYMVVIVGPPPS